MAQKYPALQNLQEQLTCSVCLGRYKEPKQLPCHHSFCEECLGKMTLETYGRKYILKCPNCRKPALLPGRGICDLPPAFHVNSLVELYHIMQPTRQQAAYCAQHNRPIEVYCKTCKKLTCSMCIAKSHQLHEYGMVSNADKVKQQLRQAIQPVHQQLAATGDALRALELRHREISEQGQDIERKIRSWMHQVMSAVQNSGMRMVQEAKVVVQEKQSAVLSQKEDIQLTACQLEGCIQYIEQGLAVASNEKVLMSEYQMLSHIRSASYQFRATRLQPAEEADTVFSTNPDALDEAKHLGMVQHSQLHFKFSATGKGVKEASKYKEAKFIITMQQGQSSYVPESLITCTVASHSDSQSIDCRVEEVGQGKWEVCYTPSTYGPHTLRVMVRDSDIPGSPFELQVTPPYLWRKGKSLRTIEDMKRPRSIAVSKTSDLVVVSEWGNHKITVLNKSGKKIRSFGSKGSGDIQFDRPTGVAITSDNFLVVADSNNHRIQLLSSDGSFVTSVGSMGRGKLQFLLPSGIAVHHDGKIFIAEGDRIQVLNKDFTFSNAFECEGTCPTDVAIDSQGIVYITDYENKSVKLFSPSGQFLSQFDNKQFGGEGISSPLCIGIDSRDNVYVTNKNNSVSIFTNSGEFMKRFGSKGNKDGQFSDPHGIAVDDKGLVYICDQKNNRVIIF